MTLQTNFHSQVYSPADLAYQDCVVKSGIAPDIYPSTLTLRAEALFMACFTATPTHNQQRHQHRSGSESCPVYRKSGIFPWQQLLPAIRSSRKHKSGQVRDYQIKRNLPTGGPSCRMAG
jgi:hypothetical protein